MTKIITKHIKDLTFREYYALSKLNKGKLGMMKTYLKDFSLESNNTEAYAIYVINDRTIIAWSLVFYNKSRKKYVSHYYTKVAYRKQGYGSQLINAVYSKFGEVVVYPNSVVGKNFFNNHKSLVVSL